MGVQINGDTGNVIATKGTFSGDVGIGGTLTYEDVTNIDSVGLITARSGIEIGASPGVAASISVDGNMIVSGITTIGGDIKVGSGVTVGKDGDIFATGVTTSSTVKVGGGVTISESGIEASGIGITCANINGTQIGGRRNIVINGAMMVAQRGTSSTTSGYGSVDRFQVNLSGTDEAPTHEQVDVSSGTTPYTLGFRKALKITNGNQTSGAGAGDYIWFRYLIEAQDIVNSGWNYISSSSFITLSFWIKSSVAQTFKGYLRSRDGTNQTYPFETGSLTADTWTKITKTIPGNSNIQIDNNNEQGMQINLFAFGGTNLTDNSVTENAWQTWNANERMKDNTTTWYTTNDATLEITGVQLEVGPQATPFEHRSFGEELLLCQRYYFDVVQASGSNETFGFHGSVWQENNGSILHVRYPVQMRTTPSFGSTNGTQYWRYFGGNDLATAYLDGLGLVNNLTRRYGGELYAYLSSGTGAIGRTSWVRGNSTSAKAYYDAEL